VLSVLSFKFVLGDFTNYGASKKHGIKTGFQFRLGGMGVRYGSVVKRGEEEL